MEPSSSKGLCPYCERSHEGACLFGTPERPRAELTVPPTPKKPKNFKCDVCEKAFATRGKLKQHETIHTGEKRYTCEHCSKGFSSKFKLARHMVVHSRVREWECEACGTGFRRKDHLEAHLRQHCGDRVVYPCELCSKTYSCKGSLRKHAALHAAQSGILNCQLCTFIAPDQDAIIAHVRTHSGSRVSKSPADKKYRCTDCDRSFFTRKDAVRHSIVHTKTRDFLCEFCPRTFGRSDHLTRHIEKSHGSSSSGSSAPTTSSSGTSAPPAEPPRSSNILPGFSQAFRDV